MKRLSSFITAERLSRWRPWVISTLVYLGLAILVTYPVILHLNTAMAGETKETSDAWEFVWSTWWWAHALLDLHQNPIQISLLNYPAGFAFPLLPLMSQAFVLPLPLTRLFSPVVAYNVTFLSSYVLCGLAGYALCSELSGDWLAGFVGGLVWVFFPNKGGHALAGHLFQLVIFTFPLVVLCWHRLLKTPTRRWAVLTGLVSALACTVHPIYLLYFMGPVVCLLVGSALWAERRAFWTKAKISSLGLAGGVTLVLVAPLLAPTLLQAQNGGLGFLTLPGSISSSLDGLSFFLPPPNNPFLLWFGKTPLQDLARQIIPAEYENVGYLGWLPLLLAIVGVWTNWARSRKWVLLAVVGGLLALGPVLKIGGYVVQVPVDGNGYAILLPSAWLGNLPVFQWSRAPGRWVILVMLALSILVTFGLSRLRQTRWVRRLPGLAIVTAVSLIITSEYVVKFPFPMVPATQPAPLAILRAAPPGEAVLQLPVAHYSSYQRALYWQTLHQHPLVGGRVYRDLPSAQTQAEFLSQLLLSDGNADIVPGPSAAQRLAMLAQAQVKWIIYDAQADSDGAALRQLEHWLGPPRAQDAELALFAVNALPPQPEALVYVLGAPKAWSPPQAWGGQAGRWFDQRGLIYVFSSQPQTARLAFTAILSPKPNPERITVFANDQPVGRFMIGDWADMATDAFTLQPGLNRLEVVDLDASYPYGGDPRCAGRSPIAGPYPVAVPCDANDRTWRSLSLALSNVRLIAAEAAPNFTPSGALFGGAVRLLGYTLPRQVKPGDNLRVHLEWQAPDAIGEDYTFFMHLYGPGGRLVSQFDGWPLFGEYPTSRWKPGEVVVHNFVLAVPAQLAPGEYTAQIGLYRWPSLERLEVTETTETKEATVILGSVTVNP